MRPPCAYGVHRNSDAEVAEHARVFAERLARDPGWPVLDELADGIQPPLPARARPTVVAD